MLDWLIQRLARSFFARIEARLDRMEKLIMTEQEAIEGLKTSLGTLKTDLDDYEANGTKKLQEQLDAANAALTEAGHEIVTLQTEVGLDEAQISDLTGKLSEAQAAIDAAKAQADTNAGTLGNLKDAVDAMDATLKQSPSP